MTYRFLPWVRQGLTARAPAVDDLVSPLPPRVRIPVGVSLSTGQSVATEVALHGPGEVIGLDRRTVIRVEPPRNAQGVNPDHFAAIEFDPSDLPWMLTPAVAGDRDRLRPWLVLVVVAEQEGVSLDTGRGLPLPRLTIRSPADPRVELPDLAESWAWAHSQIVGSVGPVDVPDHLASGPDQNLSRLLCPRRLEPGRRYLACLVPAFDTARRAGLGEEVAATDPTTPAWTFPGTGTVHLPVYHHWSFATGAAGDIESLARRLVARSLAGTVGAQPMYVGAAHPALPPIGPGDGGIVDHESAMRVAGPFSPLPAALDGYVAALVNLLNVPADLVGDGLAANAEPVAPPIYGGAHVRVERLDGQEPAWIADLNRDPRYRAIAGLGAEVVRQNQEAYVEAAWAQVGDVVAANQQLERARLLTHVGDRVRRRHAEPLPADTLLTVTGPVHQRIADGGQTLQATIAGSFLPDAMVGGAYRRMASPRSPYLRRATRRAAARGATGPAARAAVTPRLLPVVAAGERPLTAAPALPTDDVASPAEPVTPSGVEPVALDVVGRRGDVLAAVDPVPVAEARIGTAIRIDDRPLIEGAPDDLPVRHRGALDPIMIGPELPVAMVRELVAVEPDRYLSGTGDIPDDTIALLEPNQRFIEAFLIGANHELNRELLWRGYPTDRRGTPLRRFWDRAPGDDAVDLPLLHAVEPTTRLGELSQADGAAGLTLVVRGQLTRRFPNTMIYAVPAGPDGTPVPDPAAAVNPLTWGRRDPDIVFAGFALTRNEALDGDGWFFVFAEQPAELRFGLDAPGDGGVPATWSDLTWSHVGVTPGGHLALAASGLDGDARPLAPGGPDAVFGRNSAHLAAITQQRPFRAVIHAADLMARVDEPADGRTAPVLARARLLRPIEESANR